MAASAAIGRFRNMGLKVPDGASRHHLPWPVRNERRTRGARV